jgi:putative copper resistance protein D
MLSFRLLILWLHLLAAVVWIGGLLFHLLVVVPTLTRVTSERERLRLGLSLEARFRAVMWPAVGVVLLTGLYNVMNIFYATAVAGGQVPSAFVQILGLKLLLVVLMIAVQSVQQFVIRPRRLALLGGIPASALTLPPPLVKLQRVSQLLYLLTVCLAAAVLWCALLLRG